MPSGSTAQPIRRSAHTPIVGSDAETSAPAAVGACTNTGASHAWSGNAPSRTRLANSTSTNATFTSAPPKSFAPFAPSATRESSGQAERRRRLRAVDEERRVRFARDGEDRDERAAPPRWFRGEPASSPRRVARCRPSHPRAAPTTTTATDVKRTKRSPSCAHSAPGTAAASVEIRRVIAGGAALHRSLGEHRQERDQARHEQRRAPRCRRRRRRSRRRCLGSTRRARRTGGRRCRRAARRRARSLA